MQDSPKTAEQQTQWHVLQFARQSVAPQAYLQNLVLLQHLTRDVERQVFTIHNTLNEAQVLRDEVITVVHDEHSAYVQLDVVLLLLGVKQIKGCSPAVTK